MYISICAALCGVINDDDRLAAAHQSDQMAAANLLEDSLQLSLFGNVCMGNSKNII